MLRGRYSCAYSIPPTPSSTQGTPITSFPATLTHSHAANSFTCHSYGIASAKPFRCHSYENSWGVGSNLLANIPLPNWKSLRPPPSPRAGHWNRHERNTFGLELSALNLELRSLLSPMIPAHTVHSAVTPMIPAHTQNRGVG